jgi:hypothetical protein
MRPLLAAGLRLLPAAIVVSLGGSAALLYGRSALCPLRGTVAPFPLIPSVLFIV